MDLGSDDESNGQKAELTPPQGEDGNYQGVPTQNIDVPIKLPEDSQSPNIGPTGRGLVGLKKKSGGKDDGGKGGKNAGPRQNSKKYMEDQQYVLRGDIGQGVPPNYLEDDE